MLKTELKPAKSGSFDLLRGLSNHFVTHRWLDFSPESSPGSFSSTLGCSGWASQLSHYCSQTTSNLLRAENSLVTFPWSQYAYSQICSYNQFVVDHTDQPCPQLVLKAGTVFGRCSPSSLSNRYCQDRTIEDPISLEPHQQVIIDTNLHQEIFGRIVPVAQI